MKTFHELLSRFGTHEEALRNPFYLLGLPSTATPNQIRNRQELLATLHMRGENEWCKSFPQLLKGTPIPTFDEVTTACSKLQLAEYRVVAGYFWFWIPADDDGRFKNAFDLILCGNWNQAEKDLIELCQPCEPDRPICSRALFNMSEIAAKKVLNRMLRPDFAKHNLAVLYRFQAMNEEQIISWTQDCVTREAYDRLEDLWENVHQYERRSRPKSIFVYAGEATDVQTKSLKMYFDHVVAGLEEGDDMVEVLRSVILFLPAMWHVSFAFSYARNGDLKNAERHAEVVWKKMGRETLAGDLLKVICDPIINRHNAIINCCNLIVQLNPSACLCAAQALYDAVFADLDAVRVLLKGDTIEQDLKAVKHDYGVHAALKYSDDSYVRNEGYIELYAKAVRSVFDPVIEACYRYVCQYINLAEDNSVALEWLEFLQKVAVSNVWRHRIAESIAQLKQGADFEPVVLGRRN